jgi:hypothetical protein
MGSDIPPDRLPLRLHGQLFPVRVRHGVLSPTFRVVFIVSDLSEGAWEGGEGILPTLAG